MAAVGLGQTTQPQTSSYSDLCLWQSCIAIDTECVVCM